MSIQQMFFGAGDRTGNLIEGGSVETEIVSGSTKTGIVAFNDPGTVTITRVLTPFTLDITVVGGGGAGGGQLSWVGTGGGGAGSVTTSSIPITPSDQGQTFTVSIGAGGVASSNPSDPTVARERGGIGGNTTLTKPAAFGGTMTAYGGAGGGASARPQTNPAPSEYVPGQPSANASGSGGGSLYPWTPIPGGTASDPTKGNPGGAGGSSAPGNGGGGGGGGGYGAAGGSGYEALNPQAPSPTAGWAGPGGIGVHLFGGIDIPQADGTIGALNPGSPGRWVAGGGTGSGDGPESHKAGGIGGGGAANDGNAQSNTGGGGGGGNDGGTGGSGLVIFKYVIYS